MLDSDAEKAPCSQSPSARYRISDEGTPCNRIQAAFPPAAHIPISRVCSHPVQDITLTINGSPYTATDARTKNPGTILTKPATKPARVRTNSLRQLILAKKTHRIGRASTPRRASCSCPKLAFPAEETPIVLPTCRLACEVRTACGRRYTGSLERKRLCDPENHMGSLSHTEYSLRHIGSFSPTGYQIRDQNVPCTWDLRLQSTPNHDVIANPISRHSTQPPSNTARACGRRLTGHRRCQSAAAWNR